jgi:hypothetical protein
LQKNSAGWKPAASLEGTLFCAGFDLRWFAKSARAMIEAI